MVTIHPTAIVAAGAKLGENVEVGPYAILEDDVEIGDGCSIAARAYIAAGARLGREVKVGIGAVLSNPPQDLKYHNERTFLEIGEKTVIREYVTLNRGTEEKWKTIIGKNCFIMTYVHIAHDCVVGDNVILSNCVNVAGHVHIHDNVGIGGLSGIHQFVHIGRHSFVGGGLRITKDIPPYILAQGDPVQYGGINAVGLSRKGFSDADISDIKRVYRLIYRSDLTRREALEQIAREYVMTPVLQAIVDFIGNSSRGIVRG